VVTKLSSILGLAMPSFIFAISDSTSETFYLVHLQCLTLVYTVCHFHFFIKFDHFHCEEWICILELDNHIHLPQWFHEMNTVMFKNLRHFDWRFNLSYIWAVNHPDTLWDIFAKTSWHSQLKSAFF
jgi:hypothetical protein